MMPAAAVDFSTIKRVLVLHLRHYGDALLTAPIFSALKKHAPHVEVDALVYEHTIEMLSGHPAISEIHSMRKGRGLSPLAKLASHYRVLRKLRARRYDMLVAVGVHPAAVWLSWLLRPRYNVAPRRLDWLARLWKKNFTRVVNYPANRRRHQVELNLDALRQFGIFPTEEERGLVLVPGETAVARVRSRLSAAGLTARGFIVVHAPASLGYKQLPSARTAEIIDALAKDGERIVLTGAPAAADRALVTAIRAACRAETVDFTGEFSMKELAALIGEAKLVIAVDSAPVHIAAAMRTPVVGVYGPTNEFIWGPWRVPHRIVAADRYACRPCHRHGCGGCGISECLVTLPAEAVVAAARELLAAGASASKQNLLRTVAQ